MEVILAIAAVLVVIWWWNRRPTAPPARGAIPTVPRRSRTSGSRAPRTSIRFDVAHAVPDLGPKAAAQGDSIWKPPQVGSDVHGFRLTHGMLYVGRGLKAVAGSTPEPALVDPGLAIDQRQIDWAGAGLDYWPSYSQIPAASRAAYLSWLAGGRPAREMPVGYAFLYFYGLERRVLVDARHLPAAAAEMPAIRAEVVRLREAFGANNSFRTYATSFLGAIDTMSPDAAPSGTREPERAWELPIELRVRIGRCVAAGVPVPAALALEWLLASPDVSLRTPAARCPAEFQRLFEIRYAATFGAGLTIREPRKRLVAHYRPASGSFGGPVELPVGDLPDVAGLSAPVTRLRELADRCTDELDGYSRWLGRNPDGGQSLAAAALLPDELIRGRQGTALSELRSWLVDQLGDSGVVTIRGQDLLRHWPMASGWQPTRAESVSLAQLLGKLGVGVEPDVRFDGPVLAPSSNAVLFRLPEGDAISAPTPEYALATLIAHLGMAVAAADGTVSPAEQARLDHHLSSVLRLTASERARLSGHLRWLDSAPPPLSSTKKRVAHMNLPQREDLAEFLIAVAASDGQVGPAEVASLEKMFTLLGLETNLVFRRVHSLATGSTTSRQAAAERASGAPIVLDMERVGAKLRETQAVSALLGGVFASDEESATSGVPAMIGGAIVAGLDGAHSALLLALRGRDTISRAEFEGIARGLRLLPDGAVDTINDAAFDLVGHPLVEGEDPLAIDPDGVEEMVA